MCVLGNGVRMGSVWVWGIPLLVREINTTEAQGMYIFCSGLYRHAVCNGIKGGHETDRFDTLTVMA